MASDFLNLPTLMLVVSLVNFLNVLFITFAWLRSPRNPALNWWTAAVWMVVVSVALGSLGQFHANLLTGLVAAMMYMASMAFVWLGFRAFFHRKRHLSRALIGPLALVTLYVAIPDTALRNETVLAALCCGVAAYLFAGALQFIQGAEGETLSFSRFGFVIFTGNALTHLAAIPLAHVWPIEMIDARPVSPWLFVVILLLLMHTVATTLLTVVLVAERSHQRLKRLANTDMLTGMKNRRAFVSSVERTLERDLIGGALAIIDLDYFKAVNDNYGHLAGDEVLKAFAQILQAKAGSNVVVGRLGGEEFAFFAREWTAERASLLAEEIRAEFADTAVEFAGRHIRATVSIGLADIPGGFGIDQLSAAADSALYVAKASGRNQICAASPKTLKSMSAELRGSFEDRPQTVRDISAVQAAG